MVVQELIARNLPAGKFGWPEPIGETVAVISTHTYLEQLIFDHQNLIKLVTLAQVEGHYYRPRIEKELLEQYHQGLIVLSGCPNAEIPRLITENWLEDTRRAAAIRNHSQLGQYPARNGRQVC